METIRISNLNIWGLEESAVASGYPLNPLRNLSSDLTEKDINRLKKLFRALSGSGHDCAAKGIVVQFDLTAPEYFWRQLDRYHFIDHVSSQSKMHSIEKFDIPSMCNDCVDTRIVNVLLEKINEGASKREILSNVPGGFMLTSRMTTNVLQLKTILTQRRYHQLPEWREFCQWIEKLFADMNLINRYEVIEE